VREVVEKRSPWPSVGEVVTNLLLVFVGGVLCWLVVDRLGAPMWVAFVALAGLWVAGTVLARLLRRRRPAAATEADE
jgi:Flp pilus assembly protein TadB